MGSFLMSCSLTHQSLVGDNSEVYLIPCVLQKNSYSHGLEHSSKTVTQPVYVADIFQPIGVMFKATYDDYGLFDLDFEDKSVRIMLYTLLVELQAEAKVLEQGENECHDHAVNFNTLEFSIDLNKGREEVTETLKMFWEKLQTIVRQDRLILTSKNYEGVTEESEVFFVPVIRSYAEEAFKSIRSYKAFTDIYKEYLEKETEIFRRDRDIDFYFSCSSELCYSVLGTSVILDIEQMKTDEYKEYMHMLYKLKALYVSCYNMNKMLTPMYSPGQDYCNVFGGSYSLLMNKVFQDNIQRIREEDDLNKMEAIERLKTQTY